MTTDSQSRTYWQGNLFNYTAPIWMKPSYFETAHRKTPETKFLTAEVQFWIFGEFLKICTSNIADSKYIENKKNTTFWSCNGWNHITIKYWSRESVHHLIFETFWTLRINFFHMEVMDIFYFTREWSEDVETGSGGEVNHLLLLMR